MEYSANKRWLYASYNPVEYVICKSLQVNKMFDSFATFIQFPKIRVNCVVSRFVMENLHQICEHSCIYILWGELPTKLNIISYNENSLFVKAYIPYRTDV